MKNKVYRLDELCDIKSGKRIPKEMDFVTSETEHPYIRARDIKEGKINTDDLIYLEDDVFQKIKRYIINSGDIAITIVGASVGDTGYASKNVHGYNLTENAVRLTNYKNNVDSKFLHYVLAQKQYHDYMQLIAGAAAQPKLGIYKVKRIKVELPDLKKQKRIADILSNNDNLIENNNKRIKLLEQMAENLYKEWFVRFRFPGYENEHFIEDIPSSWSYVQLGDIASFDRGISYSSDEINCDDGINLINLKNVQSYGGFRRDGTKQYNGKYKDSQIVVAGDLILGVTDMTQDRRTVGSVALIPLLSGTSVISADLVKVNLKVPNVFFYCMCRYGFYSKYFSQFANGANVLHLKPNVLLNKKILLPIAGLIEAFAEKVQPMIDIVDDLNCQNDLLTKQRDMLLPRLMSGKLKV